MSLGIKFNLRFALRWSLNTVQTLQFNILARQSFNSSHLFPLLSVSKPIYMQPLQFCKFTPRSCCCFSQLQKVPVFWVYWASLHKGVFFISDVFEVCMFVCVKHIHVYLCVSPAWSAYNLCWDIASLEKYVASSNFFKLSISIFCGVYVVLDLHLFNDYSKLQHHWKQWLVTDLHI